jgi:prepilin-type N-terminal cleavage/methylation domain-containing protein
MKGFTLIEVLLCLLLFGLGMLGALASQVYARQQVLMATQRLIATAIVTDVAASLQSVPAVAPLFNGTFDQLPASLPLCQKAAQCTGAQLLQAQVAQQLTVLLSGNASGLTSAQLCIVAGGVHPEIQLSWGGVIASKFTPKAPLCPLPNGFFHVVLRTGGVH